MTKDETLYRAYLDGDDAGLTLLMERYGNKLTFYINGYLHDLHDSEDLMIEAFAYLIAKKPNIKDGCFKAYLYKMARSLSLRFIRKKRLNHCFSFEEIEKEPRSKLLIEETVEKEELKQCVSLCMERLNPAYREALYLVYFENMHHWEVAKIMKKTERQVSDLVYRGRNSLRKLLEIEGITNAEY
ncbi:MAG: sigma-70 family RNA polymerase sigma factor [Firmicutes bacterium]|nr:sigma-70 family RNA polymerase sigma factor [Bacillota bacterium]